MAHDPRVLAFLEGELPRAVVEAIELWSDQRYRHFLQTSQAGLLEEKWFSWFQVEWKIARTIKRQSKDRVRGYLDTEFRRSLSVRDDASVIDDAAKYIQSRRWSSQKQKSGAASLPLSLVSKVGFLFTDGNIVPYDSFALSGLNALRGAKKDGGGGHLERATYSDYLRAFDNELKRFQAEIEGELLSLWAKGLADRLGCRPSMLESRKFQRKVFDNCLMRIGGRKRAT
jgi:hypothetical protein